MNCKWAEGHLSACLDGTLDPAVRDEVVAHVEGCVHCSAILEEYRRHDQLVASLPRYVPFEELRERIFGSPEFAALVQSLEGYGDSAAPSAPLLHPLSISQPRTEKQEGRRTHDRALEPLPTPPPRSEPTPTALPGPAARRASLRWASTGAPSWTRAAVSAAAVLALALGSALLIRHNLTPTGHVSRPRISSVGGYHYAPLAAGARVVYESGGALWSAAEQSPGLAQQLTPAGVVIGSGWAVAPIQNRSGGSYVAYVDLKTGRLHIVRSDGQSDRIVGQAGARGAGTSFWGSSEGQAILAGLTWSPDGSQLAYLADAGAGHAALWVVGAVGQQPQLVAAPPGASCGLVAWSPNSRQIAYVQTGAVGQTIWDYNVVTSRALELSGAAEPGGSASAVVRVLGWLPVSAGPGVTWASGDPTGGSITGLFTVRLGSSAPQRLIPAGPSFAQASYSSAPDGEWLLGDSSALYRVLAQSSGVTQQLAVPGGVQVIAWAPDGSAAALVIGKGSLWLWTRGGLAQLSSGVAVQASLAWSPDSAALAFVGLAQGQVNIVRLSGGVAGTPRVVAGLSGATSLAWAPDGQRLAVATPAGVLLVDANGATISQLDTHTAAGALVWSVAG